MRIRGVILSSVAGLGLIGLSLALTAARRGERVMRVDFDKVVRATSPAYDARLAPAAAASIKEFRIPIKDATLEIAKGVTYQGWTFGGTVPGPVIHIRVGDLVRVTVVNNSPMPHSIDFHAARIPPNIAYRMIMPKDSVQFEFIARDAGAFMVHCGTPPITMHLMQGMPGATSRVGVLLPAQPDWSAEQAKNASQVVFNGRAFQYKENTLKVDVGDRVRLFVVNAGPNFESDFHIVGAIFDRVYPDGNPDHALEDVQTYHVPAGGGAVFETVFSKEASGEGLYPFVTHSFADAEKGAVGIIQVGSPKNAHMEH